jgi:hypothetical protein
MLNEISQAQNATFTHLQDLDQRGWWWWDTHVTDISCGEQRTLGSEEDQSMLRAHIRVCACVCACACVRACACVCARACVCVCAYMCKCMDNTVKPTKRYLKKGRGGRMGDYNGGRLTYSGYVVHRYGIITMKPPCVINVY